MCDKSNVLFQGSREWAEQLAETERLRRAEFDKKMVSDMTAGDLRLLIQEELRVALYPKRTQ